MPLDDFKMIIEPNYPGAAELSKIGGTIDRYAQGDSTPEEADFMSRAKIRNTFYSTKWRCQIVVYELEGKVEHVKFPAIHHFDQDFGTMGASTAWGLEQENNALKLLQSLLKPHIFKMYALTGMFPETSPRSGLTYIFRRLKPTVVLNAKPGVGDVKIIAALCMHPIAYYDGTWAGAMCPTDDVIAHLMLMRGDEPMYWRRANQHPAHLPAAGL
jgi:hypothetical protein